MHWACQTSDGSNCPIRLAEVLPPSACHLSFSVTRTWVGAPFGSCRQQVWEGVRHLAHPCLPPVLQRKNPLVILWPFPCPAPPPGPAGQGPSSASSWPLPWRHSQHRQMLGVGTSGSMKENQCPICPRSQTFHVTDMSISPPSDCLVQKGNWRPREGKSISL